MQTVKSRGTFKMRTYGDNIFSNLSRYLWLKGYQSMIMKLV